MTSSVRRESRRNEAPAGTKRQAKLNGVLLPKSAVGEETRPMADTISPTSGAVPTRYMSPPEVARLLGVGETKVLGWVKSGELAAVNLAAKTLGRPRYRISPQALDDFLAGRQANPPEEAPARPRLRKAVGWIERY